MPRWPSSPTFEQSFWNKVKKGPECWEWTGSKFWSGYGQVCVGGKLKMAHRISYELLVGPIPTGLQIDHMCRNRPCVNPAHLEAVTQKTNVLRGVSITAQNARKMVCKYGHLLLSSNLEPYTLREKGRRSCLICHRWRIMMIHRRQRAAERLLKANTL